MSSTTTSPSEIRILTLNCWGLKYLATLRRERLAEIGRQIALSQPAPEIVGLQECWTQEDYESIRESTKHILPYGKFYFSGIFGGGLAILSKWPIEESNMYRYPLNGRPTAFFRGDWFVGKGVAMARIRMGPGDGIGDIAEVFCTHLHAPYEREPNDSYICHRTAQAWEIAKLMRGAAERGHLVVGLGDFNMLPLSLAHQLITAHSPVVDAWREMHPDSSIGPATEDVEKARGKSIPTAAFNLTENGATCDGIYNTWRWNKGHQKLLLKKGIDREIDPETSDPKAKRLDYIFVGGHGAKSNQVDAPWTVSAVAMTMTQRHPEFKCSLSDHFAVEATITRKPLNASNGSTKTTSALSTPLPNATYARILEMHSSYVERQRSQRQLFLSLFGGSIVLAIACWVAVWWSPHNGVAFALTLLSSLGLAGGVVCGLIGGLFVASEMRALKEFRWEIENVMSNLSVGICKD